MNSEWTGDLNAELKLQNYEKTGHKPMTLHSAVVSDDAKVTGNKKK